MACTKPWPKTWAPNTRMRSAMSCGTPSGGRAAWRAFTSAPASTEPTCRSALLTPDAAPESLAGTLRMTSVAIGAKVQPAPRPARKRGKATAVQLERAEDLVDEVADELRDYGVGWELVVTHGDPAEELERVADTFRADVMVVGRSMGIHVLSGSVPRRLLHRAHRPLLVVP